MTEKPYKRKTGDFEVRVLKDGRVIMIAPDQELMEVAEAIDPNNDKLASRLKEEGKNGRTEHTNEQSQQRDKSEEGQEAERD